jgi:hypothetical protein
VTVKYSYSVLERLERVEKADRLGIKSARYLIGRLEHHQGHACSCSYPLVLTGRLAEWTETLVLQYCMGR